MAGQEIWRYQGGSGKIDDIFGAAALSDDSFVVAGVTYGNWNASNAGASDLVAVKISSEGTFLWAWQEGTAGYDSLFEVLALDDDSVVVVGVTYGDFAVRRLHSNGTTRWSWREGTDEFDRMFTAAVTTDGNIVVAGQTFGSWNGTNPGYVRMAAAKLHPDGAEIWRLQEEVDGDGTHILGSAARPDGSVVLAGYTFNTWPDETSSDDTADFVAIALDEHGEELWRWRNGTADVNAFNAATALADGSVVLAGYTTGDWSGNNQGMADFAAVKLDVDGVEEWRWQNGTSGDDKWTAAALGEDGSIILAGYTDGDWVRTLEGSSDFAAISLDGDGVQVRWTYQEGTSGSDMILDATARSDGAVLLAGQTDGSWAIVDPEEQRDFAAVLLTTGAAPLTVVPSLAPSSAPFVTSTSPSVPPTTLEPVTAPPSLTPTTFEYVTPTPTATPSSDPSTSFELVIVGAVVAVVASLTAIAVYIVWHRKAMGTAGTHSPVEDERPCYPQAVTPTPNATGMVDGHSPADDEPACYPRAVTPRPNITTTVGSHA